MHTVIREIYNAFEEKGTAQYGEEAVTQLQHALQCGQCAIDDGADAKLITAAL